MQSEDKSVSGMMIGVVRSVCRVDLKLFGLWGIKNGIRADLRGHGRVQVRCADIGVHCVCSPYGVHGMAHVLALDARSRVLRGNVPGHCLPSCGCIGPMRMSVPLTGCMSHPA